MEEVRGRCIARQPRACCRLFAVVLIAVASAAQAVSPKARALYLEGTQALAEHRYQEARAALAEAVRLEPDFAGAWLDLALATYASGDLVQAEELLDTLQARFVVPAALQEVIFALRQQIAARLAPPAADAIWRWQRQLTAAAGYDTNANAGLAHGELTLTLPGGALELPVASEVRARADEYAQAGMSLAGSRRYDRGTLELNASLQARRNASVRDFDTAELRAGAAWTSGEPLPAHGLWGALPGPWQVRGDFVQLRLDGRVLSSTATLGFGHRWVHHRCHTQWDVDLERRSYPVARNLDATYVWLGGALSCPGGLGAAAREFTVQLRAAKAFARHGSGSEQARPGGDSRHWELTAVQEWAWPGPTGVQALQLLAQWENVHDSDGYSPLLSHDARRRINRGTLGVKWSLPLAPAANWHVVFAVQQFHQDANLTAFDLRGRIAQVGLEHSW